MNDRELYDNAVAEVASATVELNEVYALVTDLRAALEAKDGEVARLREQVNELERLIWADDEYEAWEQNALDLMRRTHDTACQAEKPRVALCPWLKLSSYDVSLMAQSMTQQRSDDAERADAAAALAPSTPTEGE